MSVVWLRFNIRRASMEVRLIIVIGCYGYVLVVAPTAVQAAQAAQHPAWLGLQEGDIMEAV